jgi:hypothetical protein
MHRIWLLSLVGACALVGGCKKSVDKPVLLGPTVLPIGADMTTTAVGSMDCTDLDSTFKFVERYTVKAADNLGPSKLEVTVLEHTMQFTVQGQKMEPTISPLVDLPFLAERGTAKWFVTTKPSSPEVAEEFEDWEPEGFDYPGEVPVEPVQDRYQTHLTFGDQDTRQDCELTGLGEVGGRPVVYSSCTSTGTVAVAGESIPITGAVKETRDLGLRYAVTSESVGTMKMTVPNFGRQSCEMALKLSNSVALP